MRRLVFIFAMAALAGCSMRIDEQAVFRPPERLAPAQALEEA